VQNVAIDWAQCRLTTADPVWVNLGKVFREDVANSTLPLPAASVEYLLFDKYSICKKFYSLRSNHASIAEDRS
jgi:hypothetical protein